MSWQQLWTEYVEAETKRHAEVGIVYPLRSTDPISEIVAGAVMDRGKGKSNGKSKGKSK